MKKSTKFFIICAILIGIGITLSATGYALGGRVTGFGLSTDGLHIYTPAQNNIRGNKTEYIEADITLDSFRRIEANIELADLKITPSDHYGISYKHHPRYKINYDVTNDSLTIHQNTTGSTSSRQFYLFNFSLPGYYDDNDIERNYIEIFVPENSSLQSVSLNSEFGDTQFSDISAEEIILYNSYGDVKINNTDTGNMELSLASGDMQMENVISDNLSVFDDYGSIRLDGIQVKEECTLVLDSGDVDINASYFHTLNAESSYGSIDGSGVSCQDFILQADSGDCRIKDFTVDTLDIFSDYGNVSLFLTAPVSEYGYNLETDYGNVFMDDKQYKQQQISHSSKSAKQINITCSSGDIRVDGT